MRTSPAGSIIFGAGRFVCSPCRFSAYFRKSSDSLSRALGHWENLESLDMDTVAQCEESSEESTVRGKPHRFFWPGLSRVLYRNRLSWWRIWFSSRLHVKPCAKIPTTDPHAAKLPLLPETNFMGSCGKGPFTSGESESNSGFQLAVRVNLPKPTPRKNCYMG